MTDPARVGDPRHPEGTRDVRRNEARRGRMRLDSGVGQPPAEGQANLRRLPSVRPIIRSLTGSASPLRRQS